MFHNPAYFQRMRSRNRTTFGMNAVVRMNRNSGFPHHFAICRSIRPVQFQLLTIAPDVDYIYERDHYTIENDVLESMESMYLDQMSMHNHETATGDFYVSDPAFPAEQARRVRYEIQPLFLRNNRYVIPIVLLESLVGIPSPQLLVLPYNIERQADRQSDDPYIMINYLRNQNNFSNPRQMHQMRGRLTFRSEFDEQLNRYIEQPILYPRDYDNYYQNDIGFHNRHRSRTPPRMRRMSHLRAAGAVEVPEIPRAQPPPAAEPRAITLQAFTIQALISHAIKERMTCPISMNPIESDSACVTTCQHIFERQAIEQWFQDNTTCPVCRQQSSVCV